jgi:hypothetical protein
VDTSESPASHRHRATERGNEKHYARRRPEESVLYGVVQAEFETFLARAEARERPVPRFVEREPRGFLRCGILAHGFVRVHCDASSARASRRWTRTRWRDRPPLLAELSAASILGRVATGRRAGPRSARRADYRPRDVPSGSLRPAA